MDYRNVNQQDFAKQAQLSMQKQREIEAADASSFDVFIRDYFA
jgi:gamma-glutamylcysteine synthetase